MSLVPTEKEQSVTMLEALLGESCHDCLKIYSVDELGAIIESLDALLVYYERDMTLLTRWLSRSNTNFGGAKPLDLIINGRARKVSLFLKAALF